MISTKTNIIREIIERCSSTTIIKTMKTIKKASNKNSLKKLVKKISKKPSKKVNYPNPSNVSYNSFLI
jgi:hypothetical protein